MVCRVAKHDWGASYRQYLLDVKDEPDLSAAEFARRNDLNINSARRSFNKIKSNLAESNNKSDHTEKKGDRSRSTPANKPSKDSRARGGVKPLKSRGGDAIEGEKARAVTDSQPLKEDLGNAPDHFIAPKRALVSGDKPRGKNYRGVKHGAYMKLAKINPELVKAAKLLNDDDGVTTLMSARYLQMRLTLSEMMEAIDRDYGNNQPWKDEHGNTIPKSKAYANALFGTSTAFTELEGKMDNAKLKRSKLAIDHGKLQLELDEAHPLSKSEQIAETKRILRYRLEHELTAVETSYLFEDQALPLPRTLAAEADKEISMRVPERVDEPEVTAEELDQMMLDYQAQRDEWQGDWLAERQAGIAELKTISATDEVEIIE